MKRLVTLLSIFINILAGNLFASVDVQSSFITSNDGLGNNYVRHIFQDSKGFLWMSTLTGLTRYDGHSFYTFRPEKGDPASLLDYHVISSKEDKNHFLWIKIFPEFLNCYDLQHGCFVDFTGCGDHKKRYSHRLETRNGDSWLWHAQSGCRKITYKNGKFESTIYNLENGKLPSNKVKKIIEDAEGNIWVCLAEGLVKITDNEAKLIDSGNSFILAVTYEDTVYFLTLEMKIYKSDPDSGSLKFLLHLSADEGQPCIADDFITQDNWVILTSTRGYIFKLPTEKRITDERFNVPHGQCIKDDEGNLWIYDRKGLIRYINVSTGKVKDFDIEIGDRVRDQWCHLVQDSRGWVWIATFGKGLYIYKPQTDEMTHFTYQVEGTNRICSNSLSNIMKDHSDGIWVTSESTGITHLSVLNDKISYFYPESKDVVNNATSFRLIHQMKNGDIMIGNRDGDIFRYDSQLKHKLENKHFNSSIYAVKEDENGKLWLGSRFNGLSIDNEWHVADINKPNSIASDRIVSIYTDYKNRNWIGCFGGGMSLAVPESGRYNFRNFLTDNNMQWNVRYITGDKNNWMWVGTGDGLYVFHPDSLLNSPDKYYRYNFDNNKLLANQVKYILCDSKDRMWIGTYGGGLSLCEFDGNYADLKFRHFTTSDGLVHNVIQSIIEDNEGKIWIATEYGLSRLTPEAQTFENFFFSSTAHGNVFSESSAMKFLDGRLIFGTNHGLLILDPSMIESQQTATQIALTDLEINGISVRPMEEDSPLKQAITYSENLQLRHFQNSFVIKFSTFDYSINNSSKYTYKLEPYDKDWSTPSSLNFAAYKRLEPGKYKLHVKACNATGIWSEEEATLDIIVKPPFGQSAFAYILYVILGIIFLYVVFRILHNFQRLQNRIQIEKELTDYKLRFFTNISHEFRTPLTLIKGSLEKIENTDSVSKEIAYPIQLMNKSVDRLLRLVNQLLEFRKMQYNKLLLTVEETEVISFLNEIFLSFKELADRKHIDYRFESPVSHHTMYIDRGKVDKIAYNLLSNAFKYTPDKGSIVFSIRIDEENNSFVFSVDDTGVGISKEKQRQLFSRFMQSSFTHDSVGIGLHLTHELVNVHKGVISFRDKETGGSVFIVSLPLDTSKYGEKEFIISDPLADKPAGQPEMNHDGDDENVEILSAEKNPIKRKILLIEDDVDVNKFLEIELSRYYEVKTASDGIMGLEYAQNFDGDLIICDVLMPGMNGFEVTRNLKNDFSTSHIPIILLTAMSTVENQLEGTESGADAYITKPFSLKLLLARISQLIEQREKLREKFSKDPGMNNPLLSSSELDQKFVDQLNAIMEKQMSNPDFSVEEFATSVKMGRTVFFRKMKGVTGYSPNEFMRIYRMKKAIELLQDGTYNISEITYKIGMKDPHYFSRCFKEQFGVPPSSYQKGSK